MPIIYTLVITGIIIIAIISLWTTFQPYINPKIVWTHWDTAAMPDLCRLNLARTRRILHDWDVRFFTKADFLKWCPPADLPPGLEALSKQHQADFMRLWLLKKHGGTWIDSSIVLNQSINPIYNECVKSKAECSGFYIEGKTTDPRWPVFENWFIMAPANSRIIALWLEEYTQAITKGFQNYKQQAQKDGVHFHTLFDSDDDVYLTQHLCFQKVIQKQLWWPATIKYRKAEDTMFYFHKLCNWEGDCMKLQFQSPQATKVPYIKLRGGDRDLFPLSYFNEPSKGEDATKAIDHQVRWLLN